ncbi:MULTISPECIES: hypothetical protein [unclassified Nocardioides]|uniref:hypothetical protein n=1 Tax=unclassified Nocardioides TaxID=2615069 RepID=UPI002666350C|nr:hypothetical protein [Nocardioides sp. Arc9.136]WKN46588.1 hypothetical protein OSR43_11045 [Nocardioides sp. Arc9.136]
MTDSSSTDPQPSYGHDQDAEPPLTGPASVDADADAGVDGPSVDGAAEGGDPGTEDQDAQPSKNAPDVADADGGE